MAQVQQMARQLGPRKAFLGGMCPQRAAEECGGWEGITRGLGSAVAFSLGRRAERGEISLGGYQELDNETPFIPGSLDSIAVGDGEGFEGFRENYIKTHLPLLCFTSLYLPDNVLFAMKAVGNPVLSSSTGPTFPTASAHCVSLQHILVILAVFHTLSLLLFVMGIRGQ